MVIRFVHNKNNNQEVAEEQAVSRGTNCYVKISLINLKVSAICTVQQYSNFIRFMRENWGLSKTKQYTNE